MAIEQGWAQPCPCGPPNTNTVTATFIPIPFTCCYQINAVFSNPACAENNYNEININPNFVPGQTAVITNFYAYPPFTGSLNLNNNQADISIPFPAPWQTQSLLGEICFGNPFSPTFHTKFTFSNSNLAPDPCKITSIIDDITANCGQCTCKPVVSLTKDPKDSCCYFVDVTFPNPAQCNTPSDFDHIIINTQNGGTITNATGSNPFSTSFNSTQAVFSSSIKLNPVSYLAGKVCFSEPTNSSFPIDFHIFNINNTFDSCAQYFNSTILKPCGLPCDSIHINDVNVCNTDKSLSIHLLNCNNINCGITQVRWYISSPCSAQNFQVYQVKQDCSPLIILPDHYSSDLCIYAQVITDSNCPCSSIISNTANIHLCMPTDCSIQNPTPKYCNCSTPDTLRVVTSGGPQSCPTSVKWYDGQNNVVGNSPTYTPPILCFTGTADECFQDYKFKAIVSGPCGTDTCITSIRIYNINGPKGKLEMLPPDIQPLCPGEDAILEFKPACAGNPKTWHWFERPCLNGTGTQIPGSGNMNPIYYTNKLFQSVWYYVQTQNGVCPVDTVQLLIQVKDSLKIISFKANYDACVENYVDLNLMFKPCTISGCGNTAPPCLCPFTVDWYKDGNLFASTNLTAPPATISYTSPNILPGNYYAVIKDCCPNDSAQSNLVKIAPTCSPVISGPCIICNGVPVKLMGDMVIEPRDPCPDFCTYQWYEIINGTPSVLSGETMLMYTATHGGTYELRSTCNGCIKSAFHTLLECGKKCVCGKFIGGLFIQNYVKFHNVTSCMSSNKPITISCPKPGRDLFLYVGMRCNPDTCGSNTVNWNLVGTDGVTIISSGISIFPYHYFFIQIPWNLCVNPGTYTINYWRQCGSSTCPCYFQFIVPNCGCTCSDVAADVNLGFNVNYSFDCKRTFKPISLDSCDIVTWKINGVTIPGNTMGNNSFTYSFPAFGVYNVCMYVSRTPISGLPCPIVYKCRNILVYCITPLPYFYCAKSFVQNGNFTDGLKSGILGVDGSLSAWRVFPESTKGVVIVNDSAGGFDQGAINLAGALNKPATIYQQIDLPVNKYTIIEYNRENYSSDQLPTGTKLEFKLYADTIENSLSQLLFVDNIATALDTGWEVKSNFIDMVPNTAYKYLVISVTNSDTSGKYSLIGIDNLEMCTSASVATNEAANDFLFQLYPNPVTNDLTIEWGEISGRQYSLHIVNDLGTIIKKLSVPDNKNSIITSVSDLPNGVYFVQIVVDNQTKQVLKFIKL